MPTICENYSRPSFFSGACDVIKAINSNTTPEQFEERRAQYPTYELSHGGRCGWNALGSAAYGGNIKLIEHLVQTEKRELIDRGNELGFTPLHCAVINNQLEAAEKLLELGANVNIATRSSCIASGGTPEGATPLWSAVHKTDNIALIVLLMRHGAIISPREFLNLQSYKSPSCEREPSEKLEQAEKQIIHREEFIHLAMPGVPKELAQLAAEY